MKHKNRLNGLTILNTRPMENGLESAEFIRAHGGVSIACPTIEIESLQDWQSLLPTNPWLSIFVSSYAVNLSLPSLKAQQFKTKVYAAIGANTARVLEAHGIPVSFIPSKNNTESFVKEYDLSNLNGKSIALFKGEGGRKLLAQELTESGALVFEIPVYRRKMPENLPPQCKNLWKKKCIDIILGTSKESIENLFRLFNKEAHSWLQNTPWLVISERLGEYARSKNINTVIVANNGDLNASLLNWNASRTPTHEQ